MTLILQETSHRLALRVSDLRVDRVPHQDRYLEPFQAVFLLIDPLYWGRELQIMMDVLCAPQGTFGSHDKKQHVRLDLSIAFCMLLTRL